MKNESKWNYAQIAIGEGQGYRVYVEDGPTICENIRTEAEAQMLAAVPDLLEALRQIEGNASGRAWNGESEDRKDTAAFLEIAKKARAAITRAEGGD